MNENLDLVKVLKDCHKGLDNHNEPCVLVVYRVKTELEINSTNCIQQDTVVVWKGGKQ